MTTTKEELIGYIRNWVTADTELKRLRMQMKSLNQEKKQMTNKLIEIMKDNDIDTIDMNEGKLQYKKTIVKSPISKKYLLSCLQNYYKDDSICRHIMTSAKENSNKTRQIFVKLDK